MGPDYSSKLSPWLANGCLSVKQAYHKVALLPQNKSTEHFIAELFWRDFNRYWCLHNGNKVFSEYGVYDRDHYNWQTDMDIVQRWRLGMTGMPLIDACMREMNHSGFMSNRGR